MLPVSDFSHHACLFTMLMWDSGIVLRQGWGTYSLSWEALIVEYCWWAEKNNFILKIYLYIPKENKERILCQGARDFSWLQVCLSWNFVLAWCCVLTWVMKMLMQDILNVHMDCIWTTSYRFLSPDLKKFNFKWSDFIEFIKCLFVLS